MSLIDSPFFAVIHVSIGGVNLTSSPKYVQRMTYKRVSTGGGNELNIDLYDDSAYEIEALLAHEGFRTIEFSYGYSGGYSSPRYLLTIIGFSIEFQSGGIIVHIEAKSNASVDQYSSAFQASVTKVQAGDQTLEEIKQGILPEGYDPDAPASANIARYQQELEAANRALFNKKYSGYIHDIVKQIAVEEGWIYDPNDIEPTLLVPDEANGSTLPKDFDRVNKTAEQFIWTDLVPYAVSATTNKPGYRLWFEDTVEGTRIFFKTVDYRVTPAERMTYDIRRGTSWGLHGDEDIIRFTPRFTEILQAILGAGTVAVYTVDSTSNEERQYIISDSTQEGRDVVADWTNLNSEYVHILGLSSSTTTEAVNKGLRLWSNKNDTAYPAQLERVGRVGPGSPDVGSLVDIVVVMKSGVVHYTSGIYWIETITDTIDAGEFRTTYDLIRNASLAGKISSKGTNVYSARSSTGTSTNTSAGTPTSTYTEDTAPVIGSRTKRSLHPDEDASYYDMDPLRAKVRPVRLSQGDSRWANHPYDPTTVKNAGCGPNAFCIIHHFYRDRNYLPPEACDWALKEGFRRPGRGTSTAYFKAIAEHFGYGYAQVDKENVEYVARELQKPHCMGVAHMGYGRFCNTEGGGHYVTIWNADLDNEIIFACDGGSGLETRESAPFSIFRAQAKGNYHLFYNDKG